MILDAVSMITSLSAFGAKQLAADVSYLNNILTAGLGLPHSKLLNDLHQLLIMEIVSPAELEEKLLAASSLPSDFARAVMAKRGRVIST